MPAVGWGTHQITHQITRQIAPVLLRCMISSWRYCPAVCFHATGGDGIMAQARSRTRPMRQPTIFCSGWSFL